MDQITPVFSEKHNIEKRQVSKINVPFRETLADQVSDARIRINNFSMEWFDKSCKPLIENLIERIEEVIKEK